MNNKIIRDKCVLWRLPPFIKIHLYFIVLLFMADGFRESQRRFRGGLSVGKLVHRETLGVKSLLNTIAFLRRHARHLSLVK